MLVPTPGSGSRCEASIDRPMVAAIEESASSSGTPAMTTEPKTASRMRSVTGRESRSESARSSPRWSLTPLLMAGDPVSSTTRSGWAAATSAVSARSGTTFFLPSSSAPSMTTLTRRAVPSFEATGACTSRTSSRARIRAVSSRAAPVARAVSRGPDADRIRTCSTGRRWRPPSVAIDSA